MGDAEDRLRSMLDLVRTDITDAERSLGKARELFPLDEEDWAALAGFLELSSYELEDAAETLRCVREEVRKQLQGRSDDAES